MVGGGRFEFGEEYAHKTGTKILPNLLTLKFLDEERCLKR